MWASGLRSACVFFQFEDEVVRSLHSIEPPSSGEQKQRAHRNAEHRYIRRIRLLLFDRKIISRDLSPYMITPSHTMKMSGRREETQGPPACLHRRGPSTLEVFCFFSGSCFYLQKKSRQNSQMIPDVWFWKANKVLPNSASFRHVMRFGRHFRQDDIPGEEAVSRRSGCSHGFPSVVGGFGSQKQPSTSSGDKATSGTGGVALGQEKAVKQLSVAVKQLKKVVKTPPAVPSTVHPAQGDWEVRYSCCKLNFSIAGLSILYRWVSALDVGQDVCSTQSSVRTFFGRAYGAWQHNCCANFSSKSDTGLHHHWGPSQKTHEWDQQKWWLTLIFLPFKSF